MADRSAGRIGTALTAAGATPQVAPAPPPRADVVLLGPQGQRPTVELALSALKVTGPVCAITAGWQEREGEVAELADHARRPVTDLQLYRRADDLFRRDPTLASAYRERQDRLRELQRLYRLRLGHALDAARQLLAIEGDAPVLRGEQRAAVQAVRTLDQHHLGRVRRIHTMFERRWRPGERASVAAHRVQLGELLTRHAALLIAGGHVAILRNRLGLFGLGSLLDGRPVIAWSAGAMALAERIVLFHDHPPQGPGDAELLDFGLALAPGVIVLPHARRRLHLTDRQRVALLARRFAPAACVTLDAGSYLEGGNGRWRTVVSSSRLLADGGLRDVEPPPPP